jgi:hypothetical protein
MPALSDRKQLIEDYINGFYGEILKEKFSWGEGLEIAWRLLSLCYLNMYNGD